MSSAYPIDRGNSVKWVCFFGFDGDVFIAVDKLFSRFLQSSVDDIEHHLVPIGMIVFF